MSLAIQASVALILALGAFVATGSALHSSASSSATVNAPASVELNPQVAGTSLLASGGASLTDDASINL